MSNDVAEVLLIALLGVATYALRIGGYAVLARFGRLNPRVEAGLDAVPAAVIAALVAPTALTTGYAESIATAVTIAAGLRWSIMPTLVVAAVAITALRMAGL